MGGGASVFCNNKLKKEDDLEAALTKSGAALVVDKNAGDKETIAYIRISRLDAQEDNRGPTEPGGRRNLAHFKRIVCDGEMEETIGPKTLHSTRFEAILDCRAKLFIIGPAGEEDAWHGSTGNAIGLAIINEMSLFVTRPISHLVQPSHAPTTKHRSEWLVTDADHFGGLLHRVKEQKRFAAREDAAIPPSLAAIRLVLMKDIEHNTREAQLAFKSGDTGLDTTRVLSLTNAAWDAYKGEFLLDSDRLEEKEAVVRFFEKTAQFGALWSVVMSGIARPDYSAPAPGHHVAISQHGMIMLRTLRGDIIGLAARLGADISAPHRY